jgi:hypothetical protein
MTGKLGRDLTVEQGMEAARVALLNALSIVKHETGSLDRVTRIIKMVGHIASATGFTDQPQVLNGASDVPRSRCTPVLPFPSPVRGVLVPRARDAFH